MQRLLEWITVDLRWLTSQKLIQRKLIGFQEQFSLSSVFTYLHLEVVKGVLVDVFHLLSKPHGIISQRQDVWAALFIVGGVIEARSCHVGGANGFDFFQLTELLLTDNLGENSKGQKQKQHSNKSAEMADGYI